MDVSPVLVADLQAPEAVEPGERPFDHPAVASQAVLGLDTTAGDAGMMRRLRRPDGGDGSRNPCRHGACAVGDGACRASWRGWARWRRRWRASSSNRARSRRSPGPRAGCRGRRPQDGASCPVCRDPLGSCPFLGPPGAGTAAESSAARSQSMRSAWASSSRSTWCSLRQTPAWYQSRSLRQHVIPLPHPISAGKYSQGMRLQHEQDPRQRRPVRHPGPSALGLRRLRREQRRDPRPERIRQQFLRHGTLLHGSYSASLAAYATVLLGVLRQRRRPWSRSPSAGACGDTPGASTLPSVRRHA